MLRMSLRTTPYLNKIIFAVLLFFIVSFFCIDRVIFFKSDGLFLIKCESLFDRFLIIIFERSFGVGAVFRLGLAVVVSSLRAVDNALCRLMSGVCGGRALHPWWARPIRPWAHSASPATPLGRGVRIRLRCENKRRKGS